MGGDIAARPGGGFGIEDEQHAVSTVEKEVSARQLGVKLEPQYLAVEVLGQCQIVDV
jgi:hypothetical protein